MIKTYLQELQECLEKAQTEQEKTHYRGLVKKEEDYRKMLREKWAEQWKKEGLDDETIKIKTEKKEAAAQKSRENRIKKDEKMRQEWNALPQEERIRRNKESMIAAGFDIDGKKSILESLGGDNFFEKTKSKIIKSTDKHLMLELQTDKEQIFNRLLIEYSGKDDFGKQYDMNFHSTEHSKSKISVSVFSDQLVTIFENITGLNL